MDKLKHFFLALASAALTYFGQKWAGAGVLLAVGNSVFGTLSCQVAWEASTARRDGLKIDALWDTLWALTGCLVGVGFAWLVWHS